MASDCFVVVMSHIKRKHCMLQLIDEQYRAIQWDSPVCQVCFKKANIYLFIYLLIFDWLHKESLSSREMSCGIEYPGI